VKSKVLEGTTFEEAAAADDEDEAAETEAGGAVGMAGL